MHAAIVNRNTYIGLIFVIFQYVIRAPKAGVVKHVVHKVGETVKKDTELVLFEDE